MQGDVLLFESLDALLVLLHGRGGGSLGPVSEVAAILRQVPAMGQSKSMTRQRLPQRRLILTPRPSYLVSISS